MSRASTKAEVAARVFEVYKMLIAGLRREEIIRLGNSEKYGWDVSTRQVDVYIARATRRFESEAAVRRPAELGKAIARLDSLYAKTVTRHDHRTALMVQRELNDLLGLRDRDEDAGSNLDKWLAHLLGEAS